MWKTEIIFSTECLYLYNNNNQILNISTFFTAGVHGNGSPSLYVYFLFFFPSTTDKTFVLSFYHRQDVCSFLLSPTRLYEQHDLCFVRSRNCLPLAVTWVHPQFWVSSVFAELFNFLCCAFCFACLRLLSPPRTQHNKSNDILHMLCPVPNIACLFALSIID